MRLLVTGATGFIGQAVVRKAVAAGATVHGTTRARPPGDTDTVRWSAIDLCDSAEVGRLVREVAPDGIVHLASEVSGARDLELVLPMLHANLTAAVNVMVAATEHGCARLVLAGSMEEPATDEERRAPPQSPYAAAKYAAHAYARMLHQAHGTPVVHLRYFMVYGPGQRDRRKVIPYVATTLLEGGSPQLTAGARLVDWIHVDDVADATLRAVLADGVEGASIDVGSSVLVPVRSVVERMIELGGLPERASFGAVPERANEPVRRADLSAARRLLAWEPRVSLDDGLLQTVAHYRDLVAGDDGSRSDAEMRPGRPR